MSSTAPIRDKFIVGIMQAFSKCPDLHEDADSALLTRDLVRDLATLVDAAAVSLAFHAGLDRDEFNPRLVDALDGSDFEVACEESAHERDADARSYSDYRREHSTLHRAGQGC
ncbi:hypothetical protein [Methylocystis sp. S23]